MPLATAILTTKLYWPRISGDLVPRPRLLQHLEERRGWPLTLVSAPAGYGKTTLASSWLEAHECPSAWLSLDEGDDDLVLFLTYVSAAIQTMFPRAVDETRALLNAATLSPLSVLAHSLINELDQIESSFILVLDDYHHIHNSAVHDLLNELLAHPPRPMHLVLISRRDPALDLARLRARSQMTEIRTRELCFTKEETAAFVQQEMGIPVDDSAVTALLQRIEGWVAGMRLVTLSLRHRGSVDLNPARLQGSVSYVTDYLVAEVLESQPQATQDYLLSTAILDRFSASLCEAVYFGKGERPSGYAEPEPCELSGQAFVEWLEENNLFVIPLDGQGEWYRYHPLFRELLQSRLEQQLGEDGIAVLHSRASAWFAQNHLIGVALHHALAAGELETAVQLVAQHRHDLVNREQWQHLERWLRLFSQDTIEASPELLIGQAWLNNSQGRWQEIPPALEQAEVLLDQMSLDSAIADPMLGEIYAMRSNLLAWSGDGREAAAYAQKALELLPVERQYAHSGSHVVLAGGLYAMGDSESAYALLYRALEDEQLRGQHHPALLLFALSTLHWLDAHLTDLEQVAIQYLKLGREHHLPETVGLGQYWLGAVHYHRNELADAERYFAAVEAAGLTIEANYAASAVFGLALTHQAQGRPEQAREVVERILALLLEWRHTRLLLMAKAFQADLALRQGHIAEASSWAQAYDPHPLVGMHTFYVPQMTWIKVHLAQDTAKSREQAAELLSELQGLIEDTGSAHCLVSHNTCILIEVLALQALLHDAQGDQAEALEKLERALLLAEPGGWIRLFVDLGPKMAGLLERLVQRGVAAGYIAQILAAFETTDEGRSTTAEAASPAVRPSSRLVEPLTRRELEVLTLLAQRLTNKEIAAQLFISPGTVSQHTVRIYQKLDVHNRHQAVTKAQDLGILPQH